jgi:hypothetical protein
MRWSTAGHHGHPRLTAQRHRLMRLLSSLLSIGRSAPSGQSIAAGQKWWSGAGSNRRPSALSGGFASPDTSKGVRLSWSSAASRSGPATASTCCCGSTPSASWARMSSPSEGSARHCAKAEPDVRGQSDLGLWHVFGTATCIWALAAAYSRTRGGLSKITEPRHYRRSRAQNQGFHTVGRVGLEPTTGGL